MGHQLAGRGARDHEHDHGQEHVHDDGHDHGHAHGPDHGHEHEHPATALGRLRHALSDFFGGHTHDAVDQIDGVLEANRAGQRTLVISLVGLAATALVQGIVVAFSGSVALLGDALHNVADALTAVPLLVAFALARRPANRRFTYGYGRAEDLAGLFVVLVMALSSVLAAYEAVTRLLHPRPVFHLWLVAAAAVVGFVGNEVVAEYRIRTGRQIGSAALVADGLHARTDGLTSLAVLLGAGGVALGWHWADPVVGLVITVAIASSLRSAVIQVGARLMDAVDPQLVDRATEALSTVDEIELVRELRIRWIGHTMRAEADVAVSRSLSVETAHDIAHHAEEHLLTLVPRLTAATIHVSPSGAHTTTADKASHP
ncbi:cation diffusion facilitator family transporter [Pedococcus sp.]|jgi:cation diffusion facilitator family transporter|uniref:cation diffusion facilitator family transporter n=1 Tax=Pedococcus sp. TaxID=2860345 RepID=UPI002E1440FD